MIEEQGNGGKHEAYSKVKLRSMIARRINSIIGVSLQAAEDCLGGTDSDEYQDLRYKIMKVCNDISRKIEVDMEGFTVSENRFIYKMKYTGDDK